MINWSTVDKIYRKLLLTQFFTKGWGKPETIKRIFEFGKILTDRSKCLALINEDYPVKIIKNEEQTRYRVIHGTFKSPFAHYLPDLVPAEVKTARFEMIVPTRWPSEKNKPVCIHLAGTGDHGFWRRRIFTAKPLIKEYGIGSLSLENPFYGSRKPKDQLRSSLHNVSDLFVMGGSLMLESIVILQWLEKNGYGPLGLSGVSMGGHMATLAATVWDKPIPLIPCLSWSSATPVFTKGAMSGAIPWELLRTQYSSHSEYEQEIMKQLLKCPKTDSFRLGKDFALNFPDSYIEVRNFLAKRQNSSKPSEKAPQSRVVDQQEKSTAKNEGSVGRAGCPCDQKEPPSQSTAGKNQQFNHATKVNMPQYHGQQKSCNYPNQTEACCSCPRCSGNVQNRDANSLASSKLKPSKIHPKPQKLNSKDQTRKENVREKREGKNVNLQREANEFMRGVMDVTTFIGNFSLPSDTQMVISVLATQDAYIPRDNVTGLQTIWPGIEMRYVTGSHVTAALFKQHYFRQAIHDAFQKYLTKYPSHQEKNNQD